MATEHTVNHVAQDAPLKQAKPSVSIWLLFKLIS